MKANVIRIVLAVLFLAVFNVLFFVLCGTDNLPSVWLSYGFIHFAYFLMLFLPVFKTKGQASYYLLSTLYVPSVIYFLVELVVGVVFIVCRMESMLVPLIVQALIAVVFLVIILANAWANESTARSLEKREADMASYRANAMNAKRLLVYAQKPEIKKLLMDCCDQLEASASRQSEESRGIDEEIAQVIAALRQPLMENDEAQALRLAENLRRLITERKTILKYSH